jgi:hypothetical protein
LPFSQNPLLSFVLNEVNVFHTPTYYSFKICLIFSFHLLQFFCLVRGEKRVQGFGGKARRKKPLEIPRRRRKMGSKWTLGILVGGYGVDSPGSG